MERFWSNSIFKYLRVEPENHYFLLTEPVCYTAYVFAHLLTHSSLLIHPKIVKTPQKLCLNLSIAQVFI